MMSCVGKRGSGEIPAGWRAPGNQSGRGKEAGGQSLLGKAVGKGCKADFSTLIKAEQACDPHASLGGVTSLESAAQTVVALTA